MKDATELETCGECLGSGECQWAHGDCPFCDGRGVILVTLKAKDQPHD